VSVVEWLGGLSKEGECREEISHGLDFESRVCSDLIASRLKQVIRRPGIVSELVTGNVMRNTPVIQGFGMP
jgi:hypothetical protein